MGLAVAMGLIGRVWGVRVEVLVRWVDDYLRLKRMYRIPLIFSTESQV